MINSGNTCLLTICAILLLSATIVNTWSQVNCPSSNLCDPSANKTCISGTSNVKVVVELDNLILDPIYYAFCLTVDEYTQLVLGNSSQYMQENVNATVRIWLGSQASEYRYYQNMDGSAYVIYYTAVIELNNGLFPYPTSNSTKNIVFENNCQADYCILDNTYPCVRGVDCGVANSTSSTTSSNNMDVKIFLAWQGTAAKAVPLTSASLLPSNFRAFAFSQYITQFVNNIIP